MPTWCRRSSLASSQSDESACLDWLVVMALPDWLCLITMRAVESWT